MNLLSKADVESMPELHEDYEAQYRWLLSEYGKKDNNGNVVIDPTDLINYYNHVAYKIDAGTKHVFTGELKEHIPELGPLLVSMICAGGYDHLGGKAELYRGGGLYVMVVTS